MAQKGVFVKRELEQDDDSLAPLEYLFVGNATGKLLEFLIESKDFDYSLSDLGREAGVSMKTIIRDIPKLEKLGMVKYTRTVGKAKLFEINKESPIVKNLSKFMLELATVRNYHELKRQGHVKQAEQLIEGKQYFPSK